MDLAHDEILSLTDGRGADVSIVATGSMNAFDDAIRINDSAVKHS